MWKCLIHDACLFWVYANLQSPSIRICWSEISILSCSPTFAPLYRKYKQISPLKYPSITWTSVYEKKVSFLCPYLHACVSVPLLRIFIALPSPHLPVFIHISLFLCHTKLAARRSLFCLLKCFWYQPDDNSFPSWLSLGLFFFKACHGPA